MTETRRIELSPGFHSEPGETKFHLHDVYTTEGELGGNKRVHVGELMKCAVEAWRDANKRAKHWHKVADRRAEKLMDKA